MTDFRTCATALLGVFAAGEAACVSIHGANRLGGNSLADVMVFGKVAGAGASDYAQGCGFGGDGALAALVDAWEARFAAATARSGGPSVASLRDRLATAMWDKVGIFRRGAEMTEARELVAGLAAEYESCAVGDASRVFNTAFVNYVELGNLLMVAKAAVLGAINRTESRGLPPARGLPGPRRRQFPQTHACHPEGVGIRTVLPAGGRDRVPAGGTEVLMEQVVYRVRRFDGEKAFWQEYAFDHEANKTVLWGLQRIKETIDPSLAFVAACRCAVCGACAVRVNGEAVLACETPLDGLLSRFGNTLILEPLGNFPVLRDLVVDWEPKAARLAEAKPWLMPRVEFTAATGCRQTPAEAKKINAQTNCILCGACASECNKLSTGDDDFYEPYVYTKAGKFVADSRDGAAGEHLRPMLERGLWKCVHCQECVTKCPKRVAPAEDIAALRRASISRGA